MHYVCKSIIEENLDPLVRRLEVGDAVQVFGFQDKRHLAHYDRKVKEKILPNMEGEFESRRYHFFTRSYVLTRVR